MEALRKFYANTEYDALKRKADLANDDQARQDAADQQHQKYLDAEIERQQALLQLALRQKQEFQALAVGLFDAVLHGGTESFLKQQGQQIMDKVVGNAAGMAWGSVSKVIPHASDPNSTIGKLLGGTMFGADPLKGATDANTMATIENTQWLRAIATSRTGGGGGAVGGFSSAASTWARLSGGGGGGFSETDTPGSALPTDSHPGDWGGEYGPAQSVPGGMSRMAKGIGYGVAGLAAGYGAYRGYSQGSVRGAMEGTSSLAGGAASIMMMAGMTGPAAPILAGVGIALALLPSIMGDPKKKRQDELANEASSRAYAMPSGADYSMDASGRFDDYDYGGRNRQVTVVNNVYAMDSTSFRDFLIANPTALSAGLTSAIAGGNADDVVGSLQARG